MAGAAGAGIPKTGLEWSSIDRKTRKGAKRLPQRKVILVAKVRLIHSSPGPRGTPASRAERGGTGPQSGRTIAPTFVNPATKILFGRDTPLCGQAACGQAADPVEGLASRLCLEKYLHYVGLRSIIGSWPLFAPSASPAPSPSRSMRTRSITCNTSAPPWRCV